MRIAVDAIRAASAPHHFLSVTRGGHSAIVSTTGNEDCPSSCVVARNRTMTRRASTSAARTSLPPAWRARDGRLLARQQQQEVRAADRRGEGRRGADRRRRRAHHRRHGRIASESGRQDLSPDTPLEYGKSITDARIGWDDTVALLETLAQGVRQRRLVEATN